MNKLGNKTLKLCTMGMLTAVSVVLILLLRLPLFPTAPFLEYDMADVPVLIGTFLYGTPAGLGILCVVSLIQAFLLGGNGWVGFLMHFLASGAFVVVAGLIYKKRKSTASLILGLLAGTLAMTVCMIPLNLIFTVHFLGAPIQVVKDLMLPAIIPFNLIKSAANSILTALVYIPLNGYLRKKYA